MWHSCSNHSLDEHFRNKDPSVRRTFNRFVAAARKNGPLIVYAQKTRIVLMVRMRFAGGRTARRWFDAHMVLPRRCEHRCLHKYEFIPPRYHVHCFRLTQPADVDAKLAKLLREAYAIGCQK